MKFFIVLACALAAVSGSAIIAPVATVYAGPQHLPVIDGEGVPVDTAEVQHAKAAHLAHKVNAHARNGDLAVAHAVAPVAAAYAAPVAAAYAAPVAAAYAAPYATTYAAHAAPVAAAYAAPVAAAYAAPYATTYAAHAAPVVAAHGLAAYPTTAVLPSSVNGVPLETPEVVAAKANHFAAHAEALARSGHVLYRKRRQVLAAYSAPYVATSYAHHVPFSTYAHPLAYAHYY